MIIFTPNTIVKSADVNLNFDAVGYEILAVNELTTTLTSGDISVSFTPKKYLRIIFNGFPNIAGADTLRSAMRFESTTSANVYYSSLALDYGAVAAVLGASEIAFSPSNVTNQGELYILEGVNHTTRPKVFKTHGTFFGQASINPSNQRDGAIKWDNTTAQISSVYFTNKSTGSYAAGTRLIVMGHD
jgi:hypothetical protein